MVNIPIVGIAMTLQTRIPSNLSHQTVGHVREKIKDFVSKYPAGIALLEFGLRGGAITPIMNKYTNHELVSAKKIEVWCDFIRHYGIDLPGSAPCPALRNFKIKVEPICKN